MVVHTGLPVASISPADAGAPALTPPSGPVNLDGGCTSPGVRVTGSYGTHGQLASKISSLRSCGRFSAIWALYAEFAADR
jgi:hypothetical protein